MKKDTMQSEQFVISYELLHLLHWLLKYEEGELSKLITKSFIKGVKEKTSKHDLSTEVQMTEEMQNSIVDFFNFMEQEISDISNQESVKLIDHDVIKTLDHTDPKQFDYSTIKSTIFKTVDNLNNKNKKDSKQYFLKELLRQWKPNKESYKN